MELELYKLEFKEDVKKTFAHFEREMARLAIGRANPQLISFVKVECYGEHMPIDQIAAISIPQPNQLIIKPFDLSIVKQIVNALNNANLDVQIANEGDKVRLTFPQPTTEKRRELVKQLAKVSEDAKVGIRQVRQSINKEIKKDEELSEDEEKKYLNEIQKLVEMEIETIQKMTDQKEKDLMTI